MRLSYAQRRHFLVVLLVAGCLCACFLAYGTNRNIIERDASKADSISCSDQVYCQPSDVVTEGEGRLPSSLNDTSVACHGWSELRERVIAKTHQFHLSSPYYSSFCLPKLQDSFCSGLLDNVTVFTRTCHSDEEMRFLTDAEAAERGAYFLASYPGSGNTWFRLLLEETTGVYTGSVYCDALLLRSGHYGEGIKSGNVIAIKSHNRFQVDSKRLRGTIYIVRNPFHAILSKFAWKSTKAHTTAVEFGMLKDQMVAGFSKTWVSNVVAWVEKRGATIPTLVVSYDQMVANMELELHKIALFLNFPVKAEKIQCVVGHTMDVHRRNRDNKTVNPYTEEQSRIIQRAILSLRHIWEEHGIHYQDWQW